MIRRSTFFVIIAFVMLLVLLWVLQTRPPETASSTATPQPEPIFSFALADVSGLRVIGPDGSVFYATRDESGTWTLVQPSKTGELISSSLDSHVSQLISLRPQTSIDATVGLESLGLVTGQYMVYLQLVNGREILLEIGAETLTGSGYYIQIDNSEVFMAQKFTIQSIIGLLDEIPFQPTPTSEFTETPIIVDPDESAVSTQTPTP
jgi:hypothetical protein